MTESYTLELGDYRGLAYFLTVSVEPDFDRVSDFAVVLHFAAAFGNEVRVQVARIDTAHGEVHFDRLYRRDQPKDFDVEMTHLEAERHLRENWRRYAAAYERAHGRRQ